jgi:hypothetical protein
MVVNINHKPSTYPAYVLNSITKHRSRGFKLINSTSFGEFMFAGGFNQKTVKVDPIVRLNHNYPRQKQLQKTQEGKPLKRRTSGCPHLQVGRPVGPTYQPLIRMLVLHRLLDYIYAVLSSWFDPRVQN